jgi:hypothetical protein
MLERTFPASDPPSSHPNPDDDTVIEREDEERREVG